MKLPSPSLRPRRLVVTVVAALAVVFAALPLGVLPRAAAGIQQSAGSGPSLLFGSVDLATIRANTRTEPGAAWWHDLQARAAAALELPVATTCERDLRYALPDLSFAYLMTGDRRYAEKAREIHLGVQSAPPWHPDGPDPACRPIWGDYGWRLPQMLAQTAFSWDWLRGSGVLSAADDQAIRADLLRGGRILYDAQSGPEYGGSEGIRNVINYRLRNVAGLGILGDALRDTPEGRAWSAYAWNDLFGDTGRGTPAYVHQMLSSDGVYKEGQAYYQDSFRMLIPYFVVESRATHGAHDAFADPIVARAFDSEALTMMPDGDPPTIDTGWKPAVYAGGFGHWVAGRYPDKPWLMWAWDRQGRPTPAGDQWYALAFYRPDLETKAAPPPGSPTRFLTDAGYGMLRSSWDASATYVFVDAEHLPDRSAHEQPDQSSFDLYAKGAYLAIDPGDGRNCPGGDTWVRSAAAHNLVLVDGNGPRQVLSYTDVLDPAHFDRTVDTGALDEARVRMTYGASGVELTRRVALVDNRYAVVLDDLTASGSHQYDWQLHLGGAPDGSGTLTTGADGTLTWQTTGEQGRSVVLDGRVDGDTPVTLHEATGQTDYDPGSCVAHPYIQARTQARTTGYAAVLVPRYADEAAPTLGHAEAGSARATTIDADGRRDVVLSNSGAASAPPVARLGGITTDAHRAIVEDVAARAPRAYLVEQARVLEANHRTLLTASRPTDAVLSYDLDDARAITGRLDVTAPTTLVLDPGGLRVSHVQLDGRSIPFRSAAGRLILRVSTSGVLRIS